MAKGSNNIRGRSSDASKPYDVSNSFVKRVASRVTELLPQPSSWFSRWMSPSEAPNASDFVGHSLSSTITSRPPATSRSDLNLIDNVDHHAPAAKKPRTRYSSPVSQKFLRNDQYTAEDISPIAVRGGEPVAGPSTRDTRPELIASTPAVPGQQIGAKVNGDDCSETSESTSGCSSLVPQAQSSTRSLGGSRYGRSIPTGTSLDALDRRRPSFNATTFNSPLRASMRARLGSSPFYSGRTMYGGSSQAGDYSRLVEMSQSRQASQVRRVGPTVRPPPSQQSSLPLSSTAKRILDALEQFSTPMIDAKKMPVVGTKRKIDQLMPGSQRRYAELTIPSTPDLLRVKRREQLQQSTLDARQTAAQSTPTPSGPVSSPVVAEYTIRKEETDRKKHTGKVKTKEKLEDEETVVEVKLPTAVLTMGNLPKIDIAIPPPPSAPTVSRQFPTPATPKSSKFVFSQPMIITSVVTPVSVPTSTFKFSEPLNIKSGSSYTASQSYKPTVSSAYPKKRTSTDDVSDNFMKQTRDDKKNNTFAVDNHDTGNSGITAAQKTPTAGSSGVKSNTSPLDCKYHKGSVENEDKTVTTTHEWECANCKNNNSPNSEVCISCQSNKNMKSLDVSKNNIKTSVTSGFDILCKKPVGSWECSTCLIRNKADASKCIACESLKPSPKEKTVEKDSISLEKPGVTPLASSESKQSGNGFGNLFKKPSGSWTCEVCMINNTADKAKCAACETPKPGAKVSTAETSGTSSDSKQSGSGFGNLFKKPSGSWTCDTCMINNDADKDKCAACETPKPGATITKSSEPSGPKFSFGIPPAVSTSSSGVGATFNFGIPKEQQDSSILNSTLSVQKSTSSDSAQTSKATFSFGIPKSENNSSSTVTSSTSKVPTFQFGSGSVQTNVKETTSFASAPASSNMFSSLAKKSPPEAAKQVDTEKSAFSITPSSTSTPSASIKPAAPVFSMNSGKSTVEPEKTSNAPALFAFGPSKVTQNENKQSSGMISSSKPLQSTFMFGAKQEGYGNSLPSSTTNTLSSSSPSNVFKFGDTKTVSSGSGATSISSVSTQSSAMTPKPSTMFSFGSNTEKQTTTIVAKPGKDSSTSGVASTPVTENKPIFGSGPFGAGANTSTTFGSTNAFGSGASGSKDQPSPFVAQTTTNVFGTTTANTSASTFSSFGQTGAFQPSQPEKPSPVFNFSASAPQKESTPVGGFTFNPVGFPSPQTPEQSFAFNNTATSTTTASTTFNFEPKFGTTAPGISPFSASASAPTPVFGAATPQPTASFGEQATPAYMFNFGSQSAQQSQTSANPVFEFGSNQQQNVAVAPTPAPTFMFGSNSVAPAPTPANPPAFDPNIKPTFNFTQGAAAPVFSAIPTVNSASPAQPQNRKFRKAVRRTNISTVRN